MPDMPGRGVARVAGVWRARLQRCTGRDLSRPRDWVVDTLFVLIPVTAMTISTVTSTLTPARAGELALGWAACPLLWFRLRRPALLLAALGLGAAFSDELIVPMILMLFTVGVHRRPRVSLPLATGIWALQWLHSLRGLGYLGGSLDPEFAEDAGPWDWLGQLAGAVFVAALVLVPALIVRRRRRRRRARAEQAEATQLARIEQARDAERRRVVAEMYDVLAHRLVLVGQQADAVAERAGNLPAPLAETVEVIRSNAHLAQRELREVVGLLGPAFPAAAVPDGVAAVVPAVDAAVPVAARARPPGLTELAELVEHSRGSGTVVAYRCDVADAGELPDVLGGTVYRVVQEALTNARKHAPGAAVHVEVTGGREAGLDLTVGNAAPARAGGTGIPGSGVGLVGIAERVELVGGRFEHGTTPDGGFRLAARLPWPTGPGPA